MYKILVGHVVQGSRDHSIRKTSFYSCTTSLGRSFHSGSWVVRAQDNDDNSNRVVDGWERTIDGLPDYTAEPRGRAKGVEWKLRAKVDKTPSRPADLYFLGAFQFRSNGSDLSSFFFFMNREGTLWIFAGSKSQEDKEVMDAFPSIVRNSLLLDNPTAETEDEAGT